MIMSASPVERTMRIDANPGADRGVLGLDFMWKVIMMSYEWCFCRDELES